jgi:speckle-type POZ protein
MANFSRIIGFQPRKSMLISTEVTESGLHCVTLVTKLDKAKEKDNENFQLNHFPTHISNFGVSYTYREVKSGDEIYYLKICLTQSASKNSIPDYYREPCAVWIHYEEGKKLWFKKFPRDRCQIKIAAPINSWVSIKIYIKFNVKQLTDIYVNQSNCDIQFLFQDGQKIGGHISILAARSPVFAAMINNQPTKTDPVLINDTQPDIFKEVLHFIYSGRTKVPLTQDTACSLFTAAEKYDVTGLKEEFLFRVFCSFKYW